MANETYNRVTNISCGNEYATTEVGELEEGRGEKLFFRCFLEGNLSPISVRQRNTNQITKVRTCHRRR